MSHTIFSYDSIIKFKKLTTVLCKQLMKCNGNDLFIIIFVYWQNRKMSYFLSLFSCNIISGYFGKSTASTGFFTLKLGNSPVILVLVL